MIPIQLFIIFPNFGAIASSDGLIFVTDNALITKGTLIKAEVFGDVVGLPSGRLAAACGCGLQIFDVFLPLGTLLREV